MRMVQKVEAYTASSLEGEAHFARLRITFDDDSILTFRTLLNEEGKGNPTREQVDAFNLWVSNVPYYMGTYNGL